MKDDGGPGEIVCHSIGDVAFHLGETPKKVLSGFDRGGRDK